MYVSVFGFHVVVTPPTFRRTTLTRPPMYPRGNLPAATNGYMGVDYQLARDEGDKSHTDTVSVRNAPPPLPDWFMTELSSLLSLSLSSLALCDGGDPCKWS